MSRAYRLTVKEALSHHVQVEDGVCASLELLPVLPGDRMAPLVAAELAQRGFSVQGPEAVRVEPDGVEVRVSLETGDVKVTARQAVDLELSTERSTVTQEELAAEAQAKLTANARAALAADAAEAEHQARAATTARLEGRLKDLAGELAEVGTRVTAEALKLRARELGEVESVESTPDGGLVIRVKV